jgi:phage shock protein PspC (stress-responsive transcriptional regulator)
MNSSLYRSRRERLIGGVCGGIGEYLRIDPALVRLFFVLLAFTTGIGWLLYLILWAAVPYVGEGSFGSASTIHTGVAEITAKAQTLGDDVRQTAARPSPQIGVVVGAMLVLIGALALLRNLGIPGLGWLNEGLIWPILLLVGGIVLVWRLPRE